VLPDVPDLVPTTETETETETHEVKPERPPPIFPDDISNLVVWLDAAQGVREGRDFRWEDRSGAGNHATNVVTLYPTLGADAARGNLPYVHFGGLGEHLSLPSGFADFRRGLSLFLVVRLDVSPGTDRNAPFIDLSPAAGSVVDSIVFSRSGDGDDGLAFLPRKGSVFFPATPINSTVETGVWTLLSLVASGGEPGMVAGYSIYQGGTAVASDAPCYVPKVIERTSNYIGRSNRFIPGGPADAYFHGDLATLILFDRALPEEERRAVEMYLVGKWKLH